MSLSDQNESDQNSDREAEGSPRRGAAWGEDSAKSIPEGRFSKQPLPDGRGSDSAGPRCDKRAIRALLWKEWMEQRWRFALGTLVMSVMLGGMLRAEVIPYNEASIMLFWPLGTLMAIFLATGPVATEKNAHTWEFLLAQPVPKYRILLAKWRLGLYQLLAMNLIAGLTGIAAMWSRHFYGRSTIWAMVEAGTSHVSLAIIGEHPALWLAVLVVASTAALACWYTALFFILIRAKNEFTAALGGLLLTFAAHVWLGQATIPALRGGLALNPFAVFLVFLSPENIHWLPWIVLLQLPVWIGGTLLLAWKLIRRQSHV